MSSTLGIVLTIKHITASERFSVTINLDVF